MSRRAQIPSRARTIAIDPRLAVGIVLVVASIVGVVSLVAATDDSIEVYAAASPLNPGDQVTTSELVLRSVKLNDSAEHYLTREELPPEGFVATRAISKGELIPASSLGSQKGLSLTSIVLTPQGTISGSVAAGAAVDIWASAEQDAGIFAAPGVIVSGAVVKRVLDDDSLVSSGQSSAVELLVPRSRVARLLEAMANGEALSVIPANLPARG